MRRSASEIIRNLETRITQLEKSAGVMDFFFGKKEVRVLKKLSREIISTLKRVRLIDTLDLDIDREGLITGSLVLKGIYYEVSSKIDTKGTSPRLALSFETEEFTKDFKHTDLIFIQEANPLGQFYIGVEPTFEPNLKDVNGLVNRVLKRLVNRQKEEYKQSQRVRLASQDPVEICFSGEVGHHYGKAMSPSVDTTLKVVSMSRGGIPILQGKIEIEDVTITNGIDERNIEDLVATIDGKDIKCERLNPDSEVERVELDLDLLQNILVRDVIAPNQIEVEGTLEFYYQFTNGDEDVDLINFKAVATTSRDFRLNYALLEEDED